MRKHIVFVPDKTAETVAQMICQRYLITKAQRPKESFWVSMPSLPRRTRMGLQFFVTGKVEQQPEGCRIVYRIFPGILCCITLLAFCLYLVVSAVYFLSGWGSWIAVASGAAGFLLVAVLVAWQGSLCAKKFRAALTEGNRPLP